MNINDLVLNKSATNPQQGRNILGWRLAASSPARLWSGLSALGDIWGLAPGALPQAGMVCAVGATIAATAALGDFREEGRYGDNSAGLRNLAIFIRKLVFLNRCRNGKISQYP